MTPGVDFFAELERAIRELTPKPKMLILGFPSNPTAQVRRAATSSRRSSRSRSSTTSSWCTTSPTPTSRSTATRRLRSCRCRARATWRSSSSPCRRATTWPAGASASWSATRTWCTRSARIKSYHDYGSFTPIQVASIVALEGPQECVEEIRKTYEKRRDVMVKALHDVGWMVEKPEGLDVHLGARSPSSTPRWARSSSPSG